MDRSTIGLSYCAYCDRTVSSGVVSFDDGVLLPGAVQADISITRDSVQKYADNKLIYEANSFRSGTITLTEVGWSDDAFCHLTGNTYLSDGGTPPTYSVQYDASAEGPEVAFGMIADTIVENSGSYEKSYTAVFLPRVKFREGDSSTQTRGETTTFTDPTLIGTIYEDIDGVWKVVKNFTTESAAQTWLETQMDI